MNVQRPTTASPQELPRRLRLSDLSLLTIGVIIGSGIFLVPGGVFRAVDGRLDVVLVLWLIGGVLSFIGALTYGELGAMKPAAGGLYVFIRDAMGTLPAFLYGWSLLFVISSGSIAALSVAFATYLGEFVPMSQSLMTLTSVAMIAVIALINIRGTRQSANLQNGTSIMKVAALLAMSAICVWSGGLWVSASGQSAPAAIGIKGASAALVGILWAYEGWQYATFAAGEVLEPQRTLPRGLAIGTAATVAIYLIANYSYFAALGPEASESARIASDALSAVAGPWAAKLIAAAILISIFSGANALTLTAPRVYFAMANDGVFFSRLGSVHTRYGTPAVAIGASSIWAMVLAATGTFDLLLTYVVFTGWAFYALAAASIFWYRRHQPSALRPFRVPGYPVTPLLFVIAAIGIVVSTCVEQPAQALVGCSFVALGVPVYFAWQRLPARSAAPHSTIPLVPPS